MSVFKDIQRAFEQRLKTLSPLPPVAWQNTEYKPVEGGTWIRPTIVPVNAELDILSGGMMHEGFMQIDVYVPLGKGSAALNDICDQIYDHFRAQPYITSNDVIVYIGPIQNSAQRRDESWHTAYVQINYKCYEDN